ncbi:MAG TPA: M56 family metallopeptidase, partial [Pirellulales bacterium]|nr:M56 family metallopeptidase [Pirellulales bacterium]
MFATSNWMGLLEIAGGVTQLAAHWLLQSTIVIAAGLGAGRLLKGRGPAVESAVYRTTLIMTLVVPAAAWLLSAAGMSFATLDLPAVRVAVVEPAPLVLALRVDPVQTIERLESPAANQQSDSIGVAEIDFADRRSAGFGPDPMPADNRTNQLLSSSDSRSVSPIISRPVDDPSRKRPESDRAPTWVIRPGVAATVSIASVLWLVGSLLLLVRLAREYVRLQNTCRTSVLAGDDEWRECRHWAARMKVAVPALKRTPLVTSPCLAGIRRPVILLPEEMSGLPLSAVLIHELAHLRRGDCLWNLLRQSVTAVLFFQPLAWRLSRRLESAAEEVCDDYVLGFGADRHSYAESLLGLAERSLLPASTAVVSLVTLRSLLSQRVVRILDDTRRLTLTVGLIGLTLIAIPALVATLLAGLIGPAARTSAAAADEIATNTASHGENGAVNEQRDTLAEPKPTAAENSNETKQAEQQAAADDVELHYLGRVVDPDGRPVAGAKLYFVYWLTTVPPGEDFEPRATTDADGWFDFTGTITNADGGQTKMFFGLLAAKVPGFGFAARPLLDFETTGEALKRAPASDLDRLKKRAQGSQPVLTLVRDDVPIVGQVITIEGQSVAGARVRAKYVSWNEEESLDAWEKAARDEKADYYSLMRKVEQGMNGPQLPSVIADAIADGEGKFTLHGVGRERVIELIVSGPGIETSLVKARTREGEKVVVPTQWTSSRMRDREDVFWGRDLKHVAGPAKRVHGKITDADTGEPLAGVWVHVTHQTPLQGTTFVDDNPRVAAITDERGEYQLDGLGVGRQKTLHTACPPGSPYVPTGASVKIAVDGPDVTKDIQLRRGVIVRGTVIDDRTQKGLVGRLHYYAFRNNPHLPSYAGFYDTAPQGYEKWSDDAGRFEIVVPPGPGIIGFMANDHGNYRRGVGAETITAPTDDVKGDVKLFKTSPHGLVSVNEHILRQIEPTVGSEPLEVTLALTSGIEIPAKLLDPAGRPLAGGLVCGKGGIGNGWYPIHGESFHVEGYYDDRPRELFCYHPDRNLAGYFRVEGPPPKELAIKLQPAGSIRGRLLDDDGSPIVRTRLWGDGVPGENFGDANLRLATDDEGRFNVRWLVPGRKYTIEASGDNVSGRVLVDASVDAPETKDVGDVKLLPREDPVASTSPAPGPSAKTNTGSKASDSSKPESKNVAATGTFRSASSTPAPPEPEGDELVVQGQVVDPDGKPLAGADVLAIRDDWSFPDEKRPLAQVKADAVGRFEIRWPGSQYQGDFTKENQWRDTSIVAIARGFGAGFVRHHELAGGEATLRLAADEPIEGRIIDLEGRPLAGVKVRATSVAYRSSGDLKSWLEALRRGESYFEIEEQYGVDHFIATDSAPLAITAETGADGRFRLQGIGKNRTAGLRIEGAGIVTADLQVITMSTEPVAMKFLNRPNPLFNRTETLYGTRFQYAAEPSQPVTGVVRDAKTHEPLSGVRVLAYQFAGRKMYEHRPRETTSNERGRYRLEGMPKGEGNKVQAIPADGQPYFTRNFTVPTGTGLEPIALDLDMVRGVLIHGRLTNKATG